MDILPVGLCLLLLAPAAKFHISPITIFSAESTT
jgi:hypothetical protein